MKSRHIVTLGVFLLGAVILTGVYLKLRETQATETDGDGETSATVDSAREAASTTAATAFAAGVAVPVEGSRATRGEFTLWVTAEGQAAAVRRAALTSEVEGPVIAVPVREGQHVQGGQVIARVDPRSYELSLKEAQGALDRAQSDYQELTLGDQRIEDPAVREERQRSARVRSGLATAEAGLERARYELSRTEIRAPYSGRVADLAVDVGSHLAQNDSVATVVDVSSIDVEVQVLESEIAALEVGRQATVRFTAFPGESFPGEVVTINPVVNPESHYGRVTVRLRNPEAKVLPGMHATVRIAGRLYADRVSIPKDAIVERNRREVVFVFEPDEEGGLTGRAKWRYVITGLENEEYVEIVEPGPNDDEDFVQPDEIVLTAGHTTLSHDARVSVELPGEDGADT
jgi:RND family efflux transporter MFP subunit